MTETRVSDLIGHLHATFTALKETTLAPYKVQIIDGPGALDIRNNVVLLGATFFANVAGADIRQNWQYVGRVPPSRREEILLRCALRYATGNRDVLSGREGAVAMYSALSAGLRVDANAFTAGGQFQQIQLSGYRLYQDLTDSGVSVVLEFDVAAIAKV